MHRSNIRRFRHRSQTALAVEPLEGRRLMDAALDSTFDGDGKVTIAVPGNIPFFQSSGTAKAVATQSDGKIIVAGDATTGGRVVPTMSVARLNPNGSLDTTFGDGGWSKIEFPDAVRVEVAKVMIRPDNRIVVVGSAGSASGGFSTTNNFAAAQWTPNGAPDTGFDGDGQVTIQTGAEASSAALQTDGKLLIGGTTEAVTFGSASDFLVVRLGTTGAIDTGFDGDGKSIINFDTSSKSNDTLGGIAVQGDGRIVVAGSARTVLNSGFASDSDFAVARLTSAGALDSTFHATGKLTFPFDKTPGDDAANDVAVLPTGQILAVGTTKSGQGGFAVARITSNGTLDTSYDADGLKIISFGTSGTAVARSLAVQPNGTVVVAGEQTSNSFGSGSMILARLTPGSDLDTSLDGDGQLTLRFDDSNGTSGAYATTVQKDGKVVVVGYAGGGSGSKFALARLAATNSTTTPTPPITPPITTPTPTVPQTITFNDTPASVVYGQTFHVRPTSSSGLPVGVTASNATVSARTADGGFDVTALSGTFPVVLTATQAGDGTYLVAANVEARVLTTKADAAIAISVPAASEDGSLHVATATTRPGGLAVNLIYSRDNVAGVAPIAAGNYVVFAAINDLNYQGTATAPFTITPRVEVGPVPMPAPAVAQSARLVFNKKKQVTAIVLTFLGDLDAASVGNRGSYRLATPGKGGSFDAKNAGKLPVQGATYDAALRAVTVRVRPFTVTKATQLRVSGGLNQGVRDTLGRLIDGNHDGIAGGDLNALIRKKTITLL